jgi:hypothetical protein
MATPITSCNLPAVNELSAINLAQRRGVFRVFGRDISVFAAYINALLEISLQTFISSNAPFVIAGKLG